MSFEDHFSRVADGYRRFRPRYPAALFDALADAAPSLGLAWDCCAGSGQASTDLASRFERVVATDASVAQIASMPRAVHGKGPLWRAVGGAFPAPFPAGSVDLVTVAQALHWLDLEPFYAEVRRVAAPGAVVAIWSYGLFTINAEVDAVVSTLYHDIVGPYWPPRRRHVERGYRDLAFPFPRLPIPALSMTASWDLRMLTGYLRTWSASKRWRDAHAGRDPLESLGGTLTAAWGDPDREQTIRWPLAVLLGRIHQPPGR